jgi:hypothetical protein
LTPTQDEQHFKLIFKHLISSQWQDSTRHLKTDDHGHSIYFIARDGQLFGKHILPYLLTNDANISSFAKDFKLYSINCEMKPPFMVWMHSLISYMLQVHFIWKRMEIKVNCTGLEWRWVQQPESKNPYPEVNIMTPEEFDEIGEDYDDGEYSCKTLVALLRSCHPLVQYHLAVKGIAFRRQSHVACTRYMLSLIL